VAKKIMTKYSGLKLMTKYEGHSEQPPEAQPCARPHRQATRTCQPETLRWIKALYYSITQMGERQTNPVKLILGNTASIKPFKHYPENAYLFGNDYWRAYYHCHNSPLNIKQEHGHVHFFTRNAHQTMNFTQQESDWAHCFALSIDPVGQPIAMFTTNLWVTQGEWFAADGLMQALHKLALDTPDTMLMGWFRAFILAFQNEINTLLVKRDETIASVCQDDIDRCHADRNVYQLSILPIQLQDKLENLINSVKAVPA